MEFRESRRLAEEPEKKKSETSKKKPRVFIYAGICLVLGFFLVTGFLWYGDRIKDVAGGIFDREPGVEPAYVVPLREFQVNLNDPGGRRLAYPAMS